MTRTKEKARTAESVEQELEEVRARLEEMRSELAALSEPPQVGWDGISLETLSRIAEADTRRAALPAAIEDGERRILELGLELVRLRRPGAKRETERLYDALTRAEERLKEAREKRNAANYEYGDSLERERHLMLEERRLVREIDGRKARADASRERLGAPVVRSVWQQQTKDGGPGWWKW